MATLGVADEKKPRKPEGLRGEVVRSGETRQSILLDTLQGEVAGDR